MRMPYDIRKTLHYDKYGFSYITNIFVLDGRRLENERIHFGKFITYSDTKFVLREDFVNIVFSLCDLKMTFNKSWHGFLRISFQWIISRDSYAHVIEDASLPRISRCGCRFNHVCCLFFIQLSHNYLISNNSTNLQYNKIK